MTNKPFIMFLITIVFQANYDLNASMNDTRQVKGYYISLMLYMDTFILKKPMH